MQRQYSLLDQFFIDIEQGLNTLFGQPESTGRPNPAKDVEEAALSNEEKKHVAGLMRINHAGEVSAQGLYQGQALTARDEVTREKMQQSALEENDHLLWCQQRLNEMHSQVSLLNPVWYLGSFFIGAGAGLIGDKWSLGFVVETENQVVRHLDKHLDMLPPQDQKSAAILQQMKEDEQSHATTALAAGASDLPEGIKLAMSLVSKVMTKTAYYL